MLLSQLLQNIYTIPASLDRHINRISLDSRHIQKDDLFLAINGARTDGHQFIQSAIANGAAAVLFDKYTDDTLQIENQVPLIPIHQLRNQLGELAARFYHYPAKKLRMLGITGTNGKTSCSHYIAQILAAENIRCGIIGTLGHGFYGDLCDVGLTTPDAISLQSILNDFCVREANTVSMEVSSHSIDQGRINAIDFEMGIFTNLTQDHLDYHGTMEAYAAVKRRFLAENSTQQAIINVDDAYGRKWLSELKNKKSVYTYGYKSKENSTVFPSIYADNIQLSLSGIKARVHTPWGNGEIETALIGEFNLSNVLATLTALCVYGMPLVNVLQHLSQLKAVAGRMQTLGGNERPRVVVDYAHTPDALEKALQALRLHTKSNLICVFGCGGDRDHGKRPQMAEIAEHYADKVIVTNDNPRHEKPEAIAVDIMHGFARPERVIIELNRSKAIQKSIQLAEAQDCILIAGKGAEHYQQVGDEKIPFDDADTVRKFLN